MEKLKVLPLPEQLYRIATRNQIDEIHLEFYKKNEETFLDVHLYKEGHKDLYLNRYKPSKALEIENLYNDIEDWAWRAYNYEDVKSPDEHGTIVAYFFKAKKTRLNSWAIEPVSVDAPVEEGELEIEGVDYGINRSKLEKIRRKVQDISSYVSVISEELREISKGISTFTEDNNDRD